jgi:superfamily II DNA/RNA helicase
MDYFPRMPFSKLGLSPTVLEGVKAMGYVEPTPIQLRAIPLLMQGRDVIGSAQTGTGKTAAFALPILTQLGDSTRVTQALILEPTRELAAQVETAVRDLARFTNMRIAVLRRRRLWQAERSPQDRRGYRRGDAGPSARSSESRQLQIGSREVPDPG